jgi:Na+-transporting methylmalonyl-CoA/oxaloacetate decarboxylase gamma subunit
VLQFLIVLAILAVVVIVVTAPLRRVSPPAEGETSQVAELEAAREAKYREIRDAELDHSTGKLSDADFEAVDQVLRAEAVEILHELDRAREP